MSKLKERIGMFELNEGVVNMGEGFANRYVKIENKTERVQERISEILLTFIDRGVAIDELLENDNLSIGIATGYNTIIYYEYVAEDTVGGAIFVNVEPVRLDNGYRLDLVLYEEFDGHVEEVERYREKELTKLIQELPNFLQESEKVFQKLDKEYKQKGY